MSEQPVPEPAKYSLNPAFKDYYHKVFKGPAQAEKKKLITHSFGTLITQIASGVDVALYTSDLRLSPNADKLKIETSNIRKLLAVEQIDTFTDYLRSIDEIIELTKDLDLGDDEFLQDYIGMIPRSRSLIASYIDMARFIRHPGTILWNKLQSNKIAPVAIMKDNISSYEGVGELNGAEAMVLYSLMSKFSQYFTGISVKLDEKGEIMVSGDLKYDVRPKEFERYKDPLSKRKIPNSETIMENNGIDFSSSLFVAEMISLAMGKQILISYQGNRAKLKVI